LLAAFPERLSAYADRKLKALGVEVRTGEAVDDVRDDGIIAAGHSIAAGNVFWCAGTEATPAAQWTNVQAGLHGLIKVTAYCSVVGHDDIFAIGDVADMAGPDGKPLPALAPVAKQQGHYLGRMIRARIEGRSPPKPFRYRDYGQLAVLGRSAAIADFGWLRLTGVLAWMIWSAVHLFLLLGARNKILVYLNWVWAWMTYGHGARLMTGIDRAEVERSDRQRSHPDAEPEADPSSRITDRQEAVRPIHPPSSWPGVSGPAVPAHGRDEAAPRG
jgi:NADH dehydrogenase